MNIDPTSMPTSLTPFNPLKQGSFLGRGILQLVPAASFTVATTYFLYKVFIKRTQLPIDDYASHYQNARWKQAIELGKKTLNNQVKICANPAQVHLVIANSYFYLGEYEKAKEHANQCDKIQGLCLLSACFRAEGSFDKAKEKALEAEKSLTKATSNTLKGQVYLNLEAAAEKNLQQARTYYNKALTFFEGGSDGHNQATIQLAKVLLLQDKSQEALKTINTIEEISCEKMTAAQLNFIKGHIFKKLKEERKEGYQFFFALQKAAELNRKINVKDINGFLII